MSFKIVLTKEERRAKADKLRQLALRQFELDTPDEATSPIVLAKKLQQFSAGTSIPLFADVALQKLELCEELAERLCDEGVGSVVLANALLALGASYDVEASSPEGFVLSQEQLQALLNA